MFFEADSAESSGFVSSLFSSGNGILDSDLAWILRMKLQLPTTTPKSELKTRLLESDRVRTALVDLEPDCVGRVERIVEEMAADMRGFDMRVLGFVFRKVWRRLYDAVYVHQEGLEKIKQAQKRGPVVLLPTHRSHIDYLIMTYILVASGIQPPAVVAGDNLKIPVVGNILHKYANRFYAFRSRGGSVILIVFVFAVLALFLFAENSARTICIKLCSMNIFRVS